MADDTEAWVGDDARQAERATGGNGGDDDCARDVEGGRAEREGSPIVDARALGTQDATMPLGYALEQFEVRDIDEEQAQVTPFNEDGRGFVIRGYSARDMTEYGDRSRSTRHAYDWDEEKDAHILHMIATSRGVRPTAMKNFRFDPYYPMESDLDYIHLQRQRSYNLGREPSRRRLVWTKALHKRFAKAVDTLGLHTAVPKAIMELMQVPGLTRENIASHLQKYRAQMRATVPKQ